MSVQNNISVLQDTDQRVKRKGTEWEKIIAKHITDKRLVSKYAKNKKHLKLKNKK